MHYFLASIIYLGFLQEMCRKCDIKNAIQWKEKGSEGYKVLASVLLGFVFSPKR
jgi:hypothetical protein